MDYAELADVARKKIKNDTYNFTGYDMMFKCAKSWMTEDVSSGVNCLTWLRDVISDNMGGIVERDIKLAREMMYLYKQTLLSAAKYDFDSFMLALEANRAPSEQFWRPRRKHLMPICKALQALEDDELDELFLAQPPRTGKSTLVMFFVLWVMGRHTEKSNLYSSFSEKTVITFFNGLLEVLRDPVTYDFGSVFPGLKLIGTNANDATLDLERRKRYHSFTGRAIGGSLNGSCDCNGYIIGDDLCSGIEEAMSKERMASLWWKVDNNFLTRAKEKCKRLWIGTRWSLVDPQGLRLSLLSNDPQYLTVRWKSINVPALNESEESNFDYSFGVGFSTEYYHQRRASFERNNDMASWLAQYQGEPIERDGAVFNPDDLRYYNGILPDGCDPDRIFMAVDPAWGGGDFVAAPVIYQYGDELYVADVVYNNGDKKTTQPMIVKKVVEHNVQALFIEATKMTASYPQEVDAKLQEKGVKVNIQNTTKHFTGTGKEQRIFDKAPDIRERMIFLESGKRSKEYELFMQNLFSFTIAKKNQHDDAPDSLAIALSMAIFGGANRVEIVKRMF